MDKIKEVSPSSLTSHTSLNYPQKLTSLRNDADNAIARAEDAEARNKKLEQELLEREQENTSLNHRLTRSDAEIDELETQIKDLKQKLTISSDATSTNEGLARKVQLLEEELDACEKNLRETTEKCVDWHLYSFLPTHLQVEAGWFEGWTMRTKSTESGAGITTIGRSTRGPYYPPFMSFLLIPFPAPEYQERTQENARRSRRPRQFHGILVMYYGQIPWYRRGESPMLPKSHHDLLITQYQSA